MSFKARPKVPLRYGQVLCLSRTQLIPKGHFSEENDLCICNKDNQYP